jgi:hypothetical protein
MPRIPIYQRQLEASGAINARGIDQSAANNGFGALAKGISDVGSAVHRLEQERSETEARLWVANATSEMDLSMAEFLQKSGESAQPGAKDFTPSFLKDFDKYADETLKNAPSSVAKNLLSAHIAGSRSAYGKAALGFEASERVRYAGSQIDEGVSKSTTIVGTNPAWFDREMGKWSSTINAISMPEAQKTILREKTRQMLVNAAVTSWIDRNPEQASAIFKEMKNSDDPSPNVEWSDGTNTYQVPVKLGTLDERMKWQEYADRKKNESAVKTFNGLLINSARSAVDSAKLLPGDIIDLPSAKALAVESARSVMGDVSPEQTLKIEEYVERVAADKERDIKRRRESTMAGAFDALDANGGDYQALLRDRPELTNQLNQDQLQRVNRYAGDVATGATRPTDWIEYNKFISDPEYLKAVDLKTVRDLFNAKEYAQLSKIQDELINDPIAEQNLIGTHSLIKGMLEQAGFKNKKDAHGKFFGLLQQAVDQELAVSGKKALTQMQVKTLAEDLLLEEITSGRRFFGLLGPARNEAFDIEVPDVERIRIEAALKNEGIPVNDYNVLNAYRAKLRRNSAPEQEATSDADRIVTPSEYPDIPPLLESSANPVADKSDNVRPSVIPAF